MQTLAIEHWVAIFNFVTHFLQQVREATRSDKADPRLAVLLERIGEYSNIPRKKAKFQVSLWMSLSTYSMYYCCVFVRLFKIQKNGIFLFGISILEILTVWYYANLESHDVMMEKYWNIKLKQCSSKLLLEEISLNKQFYSLFFRLIIWLTLYVIFSFAEFLQKQYQCPRHFNSGQTVGNIFRKCEG